MEGLAGTRSGGGGVSSRRRSFLARTVQWALSHWAFCSRRRRPPVGWPSRYDGDAMRLAASPPWRGGMTRPWSRLWQRTEQHVGGWRQAWQGNPQALDKA